MDNDTLRENLEGRYAVIFEKVKLLEHDPDILETVKSNANGSVQHPKAKTYLDLLKQLTALTRAIQNLNKEGKISAERGGGHLRDFMK